MSTKANNRKSLELAWRDLLANGKQGRTIPEIAEQHGANPKSFQAKYYAYRKEVKDSGGNPDAILPPEPTREPAQLTENQSGNLLTSSKEHVCAKMGDTRPNSKNAQIAALQAEVERLNRLVGSKVDAALLMATEIPCKTAADLERLYKLRLATLGVEKGGDARANAAPLIQVKILSTSTDRPAKPARITENGSDSVTIDATSEEIEGE